ncbi:glyoxalase/bleomycin resistance protein/dioxygenase [Halogeometricum pallidum JCM 14848]|uniref:Glyoxalase/bleomycin resistance protein/dioxygenase n=1 Tax=Halogeometricum pallidum JCM 14848 TaxID=1227487 RepID=M0DA51_HALPD|nr:VOC family protein [Halogeometricum pallidum]ELZ31597.1 glyoxalase/bleomycin resistance protein/dioxygenase [Halogeometricum pallidum JCM 14848]
MLTDTPGIHHVTAMVGDPQANLDFYVETLGLRLVKRTVNHEDVLRYHFYYGNGSGDVGTVYTCFPYPNEPPGRRGRPGIPAAAFAVPPGSLDYWTDRLADRGVAAETRERFGETVLRFEDPSGTCLELVAAESPVEPWTGGSVPADVAIRGIHGVTTHPVNPYQTAGVLETLGFEYVAEEGERVRYEALGDRGTVVDLLDRDAPFGREGVGSIHHVALRVPDEDELREWHDLFRERDIEVSRIRDRRYYRAIYVREPGGVLIELSTEKPGFDIDESEEAFGSSLVLPPWAEEDREMIAGQLPPVDAPGAEK